VLLLELHRAHAAERLLALDALLLARLEDLLVLDAQLAALDVEAVQRGDDRVRVGRLAEVGEGEPAEGAGLVEVVVERVRGRDGERCLWVERSGAPSARGGRKGGKGHSR
jgi:hypothetical protein